MTLPVIIDRHIKPYILFLAFIFTASFFAGTFASASFHKEAAEAVKFIAGQFQRLSGGTLFFYILTHNLSASILFLFTGLLFGIIPVLAIGADGFFHGVLYREEAVGTGYWKAALKVLPHGVFDIPALLIAASYGLWLGVMVVKKLRGRDETPLRFHIGHASRRYLAVVFPLLIIAAAVETALIVFWGGP